MARLAPHLACLLLAACGTTRSALEPFPGPVHDLRLAYRSEGGFPEGIRIPTSHRRRPPLPTLQTMELPGSRRALGQGPVVMTHDQGGATHLSMAPGSSPPRQAPVEGDVSLGGVGMDFGSGEAPYDDNLPSNSLLPEAGGGFSDALLQLSYRHQVWAGGHLVGVVAASRYQDMALLDALPRAELTWVMIGVHLQF